MQFLRNLQIFAINFPVPSGSTLLTSKQSKIRSFPYSLQILKYILLTRLSNKWHGYVINKALLFCLTSFQPTRETDKIVLEHIAIPLVVFFLGLILSKSCFLQENFPHLATEYKTMTAMIAHLLMSLASCFKKKILLKTIEYSRNRVSGNPKTWHIFPPYAIFPLMRFEHL